MPMRNLTSREASMEWELKMIGLRREQVILQDAREKQMKRMEGHAEL